MKNILESNYMKIDTQENIGLAIIALATIIVLTMEWWYV